MLVNKTRFTLLLLYEMLDESCYLVLKLSLIILSLFLFFFASSFFVLFFFYTNFATERLHFARCLSLYLLKKL